MRNVASFLLLQALFTSDTVMPHGELNKLLSTQIGALCSKIL